MAKSTVTVILSGDILLSDIAAGVERFRGLMDALTKEGVPQAHGRRRHRRAGRR